MKKVLVTGGAGFIGSHTVEELINKNYQVFVLDNLDTGKLKNINSKKVTIIKGDITDKNVVDKVMKKVDFVIHLAAIASVSKSMTEPLETHTVNVTGTLNIFRSAAQNNIKRVVYASSAAIYGDNEKVPLLEDSLANPTSHYGLHKYMNELVAKLFNKTSKTEFIGLRYFNIYGPRQSLSGGYPAVIPNFCLKILNNEVVKIFGDGKQFRDFVFVKDLAKINVACLEKSKLTDHVFNVGNGIKIDLNNLIKKIEKITGRKAKVKKEKSAVGDIKKSLANIDKLSKNFKIKNTPFDKGLAETIDYYKSIKN